MLRSKNISTLEIQGLAESFDNSITNSATKINYVFIHRTVGNSENPEGKVEIQTAISMLLLRAVSDFF